MATKRSEERAARQAARAAKREARNEARVAKKAERVERREARKAARADASEEEGAAGPKTLQGRWFWKDRVVADDWRIQEHVRFGRVRVIDADARRPHTGTTFDAALAALPRARAAASDHLVFLLHGYGGSLKRMVPLRDRVRGAGMAAEVIQYPSIFRTVGEIAENLANLVIESARHRTRPPAKISLVGFSMGGLVASGVMHALARRKDAPRLGRLLTIGTPHGGSPLANAMRWATFAGGPNISDLTTFNRESLAHLRGLTVPLGVIGGAGYRNLYWPILGDGDGIVPIGSAVDVAGAVGQFVVNGYKHTALPAAPEVIEQSLSFLESGRFS